MTEHLAAFIGVALLLNISPGPDQIYVLGRTLAQGRFVGFVSSWGVCSGAFVHVFAAAFGFSLIIKSSPTAYAVLKYAGAAYMVWLAINTLRHNVLNISKDTSAPKSLGKVYLQGILVDVLNPKVAIFFLAFLPQFVSPAIGNVPWQMIQLGLAFMVVTIVVFSTCGILAHRASAALMEKPSVAKTINTLSAFVFLGLGLKLAFSER